MIVHYQLAKGKEDSIADQHPRTDQTLEAAPVVCLICFFLTTGENPIEVMTRLSFLLVPALSDVL